MLLLKHIRPLIILYGCLGLLFLVSCNSAATAVQDGEITLIIGPEITGCEGEGIRHCMQVKFDPTAAEWGLFPQPIVGFDYEQDLNMNCL